MYYTIAHTDKELNSAFVVCVCVRLFLIVIDVIVLIPIVIICSLLIGEKIENIVIVIFLYNKIYISLVLNYKL